MFDDYNHGSDMKKNGTGGYPILTGDRNGNFKDFNSNIIRLKHYVIMICEEHHVLCQ